MDHPKVERTEITANCEKHGSYLATTTKTTTTGGKTYSSTSTCPQCMEQLRERRRRGFDETQNAVICEHHGEYTATTRSHFAPDNTPTWAHTSKCPSCEREWEEQREEYRRKQDQEMQEEQRRKRIDRNRKAAAIPARFVHCAFDNYLTSSKEQQLALSAARGFAENFDAVRVAGSSLTLCGNPGCGKTHLACAIANHLLNAGKTVIYTTVLELIRGIRDTWRRESSLSETDVVLKYRGVDLLILDEVGVSFGSEAERNQLFDVLDGRYREMRPTVIVSNLNGKALQECLGPRIFDRLMETGSTVVTFKWGSYRLVDKRSAPSGLQFVETRIIQ